MISTTKISVRALAYGGKFIGQPVGFAKIDIYGPENPDIPLASGLADQGLVENTDGSGITPLIMGQSYPWGYPVRADLATEFTAEVPLTEPTVLTFVATSVADPRISASVHRLIIPNVPLTGAMAVVIVIFGLLTELTEPTGDTAVIEGTPTTITARVRMMCGCHIDNLFWPAANFNVRAIVSHAADAQAITLSYIGIPSYFSVEHIFQSPGIYKIRIFATEVNGNSSSTDAAIINVNQGRSRAQMQNQPVTS